MSMQRISYRLSGFRSTGRGLWFILTLLCLLLLFSVRSYADTVDLSVTYGYQNTAKAGRRLPLSIGIENHQESTFSGYIHVYMVESEDSVYEYRYQKIVEGGSSDTLNVTVSLSSGISQLLVTAEDREGHTLGSRRIGLDVAGSDAELIIGIRRSRIQFLELRNFLQSFEDGVVALLSARHDRSELLKRTDTVGTGQLFHIGDILFSSGQDDAIHRRMMIESGCAPAEERLAEDFHKLLFRFTVHTTPAAGSQNDRIDFSSVIHRYLQITKYDSRIMYPYHIRFSAYKKCLSSAASGISKIILIYGCLHLVQFVTVRRASGSGRH